MANISVKVLKDKNQEAFVPFTITDAVFVPDTDKTVTDLVDETIATFKEAMESIPTKTSDLTNDSGFIDNTVDNLVNYTLSTGVGATIDMSIDTTTYVLTLSLKNAGGTVLSTDTVDLPIESMVVNATYDTTNKKIILTLQSGTTIDVPIGDIISGLQTEITASNKLDSDLVDDTNSTNKFVTTNEKSTWSAKYDKPNTGIPSTDLASAVQTSLGKADTALQAESDPVFGASPAAGITANDIGNWTNKQDELVSSVNIRTVNGNSLLGSGDLEIATGSIDSISVNGTVQAIDMNKNVDITVPTLAKDIYLLNYTNAWSTKTWNGYTGFGGNYIWTDGKDIYFSDGGNQYVLDKATSTWSRKTWVGYSYPNALNIWTDGEHIYSSINNAQYVLDVATSTWTRITWNVYPNGPYIWTDGENTYYSYNSNQYVLDKSTGTWSAKTWTGLTNFVGSQVWTDGENIYYSNWGEQYVLDKSTSTWSAKTWSGATSFYGNYIWTDGKNIYLSNSGNQYVLDKSTSTWNTKTWAGLTNFTGNYVWTDGENIYYSSSTKQYILGVEKTSVQKAMNELTLDGGGGSSTIDSISVNGVAQTIDANKNVDITVPTTLSSLSTDSTHRVVTDTEKSTWNSKSNFSGNYNDLTNKPNLTENIDTYNIITNKITISDEVALNKTFTDGDGLTYPLYRRTIHIPSDQIVYLNDIYYRAIVKSSNMETGYTLPTGLKRMFIDYNYSQIVEATNYSYYYYPLLYPYSPYQTYTSTYDRTYLENARGDAIRIQPYVSMTTGEPTIYVMLGKHHGTTPYVSIYVDIVFEYTKTGEGQ